MTPFSVQYDNATTQCGKPSGSGTLDDAIG